MRLFAMLLSLSVLALGGVAAARTDQPSGPAVDFSFDSGTTVWVFPHLFHLDASNTSSITVTNHSQNVTIDLDIDFRTQVGDEIAEVNVQVAPRATRSFPLADTVDEGFVGTAVIFCGGDPCLAVGTWEFDFGEDNRFLVGVPPSSATTSDTEWATVTNDPTGSFAVAVFKTPLMTTTALCAITTTLATRRSRRSLRWRRPPSGPPSLRSPRVLRVGRRFPAKATCG